MIKIINKHGTIITGTKNGWEVILSNGTRYNIAYNEDDNGTEIDNFCFNPFSNCKHVDRQDYNKMDVSNYFELKKINVFDMLFGPSGSKITLDHFNLYVEYKTISSYESHCWEVVKCTDDEEYSNDLKEASKTSSAIRKQLISEYGEVMSDNPRLDLSNYPELAGYKTTKMHIW